MRRFQETPPSCLPDAHHAAALRARKCPSLSSVYTGSLPNKPENEDKWALLMLVYNFLWLSPPPSSPPITLSFLQRILLHFLLLISLKTLSLLICFFLSIINTSLSVSLQDSSGMRLWKRKWFVLADFCLFYYKGASRSPHRPRQWKWRVIEFTMAVFFNLGVATLCGVTWGLHVVILNVHNTDKKKRLRCRRSAVLWSLLSAGETASFAATCCHGHTAVCGS